jgi:serine/threonine protein kinase
VSTSSSSWRTEGGVGIFEISREIEEATQTRAGQERSNMNEILGRTKLILLVHRDLKPENVLYKDKSHHSPLVIADFGIAKHLEYDDPEGEGEDKGDDSSPGQEKEGGVTSMAGSFGYASPEVLAGKRHGVKVDCWSIGWVRISILEFEEVADDLG